MKFIIKIIFIALAVLLCAHFLPGVAVENYVVALVAAVVIALLNAVLRPVLVLLTIPLTILTLGLFLLVINAAIILLTDYLVEGFAVEDFWWALLFSLIVSITVSILDAITGRKK